MTRSRDHGGNLDTAIARFGGAAADWLDLSTGINPTSYPLPQLAADCWRELPSENALAGLRLAAQEAYDTPARVIPMNGAQAVIQVVPRLRPPGRAAVLAPTYNEHAAALRACGWQVDEVPTCDAMAGADLAVAVNPNNPDGQRHAPGAMRRLSDRVGLLVIDESFADADPQFAFAPHLTQENVVVLRSFGKFYGLAGVRLGFALAHGALADRLAEQAGPWPVSGPSIEIACKALADRTWQRQAIETLQAGASRLDALANRTGWQLAGGTPLFRTYAAPSAVAAQETLATHRVWSRIFPYSDHWIRLGLADDPARWEQLAKAMEAMR